MAVAVIPVWSGLDEYWQSYGFIKLYIVVVFYLVRVLHKKITPKKEWVQRLGTLRDHSQVMSPVSQSNQETGF